MPLKQVGCDGLFESLNINELCQLVYENRASADIAELLVNTAQNNGSTDNITAIFVLLKDQMDRISNVK